MEHGEVHDVSYKKRSRSRSRSPDRRQRFDKRSYSTKKPRSRGPLVPYRDNMSSIACPGGCGFFCTLLDTVIKDDQGVSITHDMKSAKSYTTSGHSPATPGHRLASHVAKCGNDQGCHKIFSVEIYQEGKAILFKTRTLSQS